MSYRIPVYMYSSPVDERGAWAPSGPSYQIVEIDTVALARSAEAFIMESRYRTGRADSRYLLVGWDKLRACAIVPGDMERQPFYQKLGYDMQVMGHQIVLVGSMDGFALLPWLGPEPKATLVTERGELIAAHMRGVAKQVLTMGVHADRHAAEPNENRAYKNGVFDALRLFCEGLGIENPQGRSALEKEALRHLKVTA